jgi:cytochrome P450
LPQLAALLDRVVRESLRLLLQALWWGKVDAAQVQLGPYPLAGGRACGCQLIPLHRLLELYPPPNTFWPDRWVTWEPIPSEYLPFSAGLHACLGPASP